MKPIATALAVVVLTCGTTFAQDEPGPSFEHLKCYGPFVGHWRYEGPLLEDVPNVADKGSNLTVELSWKRILNKNAVEHSWSMEFANGNTLSGKSLIGWHADDEEIVTGGMDSIVGVNMGNVESDAKTKTLTVSVEGVDGKGEETSSEIVCTKIDKDTLTWQASDREGGLVEGPSPVYTFKRVQRTSKKAE